MRTPNSAFADEHPNASGEKKFDERKDSPAVEEGNLDETMHDKSVERRLLLKLDSRFVALVLR